MRRQGSTSPVRTAKPRLSAGLITASLAASGVLACCTAAPGATGRTTSRTTPRPPPPSCPILATAGRYAAAVEATGQDWGADVWASVRLVDGRTLWLLGDTVRTGHPIVHSAYVMQDRCGAMSLHADQQLLPYDAGDQLWVIAAARGPSSAGTTVYATVERTRITDPGNPFGFEQLGAELATLWVPPSGQPRYLGLAPLPTSGQGSDGVIQWGEAIVPGGDGWLYVYGSLRQAGGRGRSIYLARVPVGKLTTLAAWQYRTTRGWSAGRAAAAELWPAAPTGWGAQFTVHRASAGRWVAVTRPNDFLGDHVSAFTAGAPWGPWTERRLFADPAQPGQIRYAALAHGALPNGDLLITVCTNYRDTAAVLTDPAIYRPTWHQVTI